VIQGDITYAIDVTEEPNHRIVDLRYRGKPIRDADPFIVVTNNYRASGGGHFPGLDGSNIVLSAPDANRDVLIAWVQEHNHLTRRANAERNWRFAPKTIAGPVVFTSAAGKLDIANAAGIDGVRVVADKGDGFATYAIDFAAKRKAKTRR
jgi:2',3'-cyclic-nucleotide 2'-phosphodiesterase/3'-nucleotidase